MQELERLSIVIPSYNSRGVLGRVLEGLGMAAPGAEVIVVDGSSPDGSADMVRNHFPTVRLVESRNHGWAHATNRGLEVAHGDYLLLLNSDLFVTRPAIDAMLDRLVADERLGGVAPVLLNDDGSRQWTFSWWYWPNWRTLRRPIDVPLLHGACLMTRRDVLLETGGLDETFFLYNEEYDWCIRARRAGYRMELVPERVVHIGRASTPPGDPAFLHEMYRGFIYMLSKHFTGPLPVAAGQSMELLAKVLGHLHPRADWRAMWADLEAQLHRRAYEESPFPASGRGAWCATPAWAYAYLERPESITPETELPAIAGAFG